MTARLTRRRLLASSAAGAALIALPACSGDDDDTGTPPAGAASPTPTSARAASPTTTPSELIIAGDAEPDDLLPFFSGFSQAIVLRSLYETLFEVRMTPWADRGADVQYVPMLAERWEQLDPTTFRFTLRQGVKFHDGEPWNARAAVSSFQAMADQEAASALKKTAYLGRVLKSMTEVDEYTVEAVAAFPTNLNELGLYLRLFYSAVSPKALEQKGLAGMLEAPVGTGPFAFASWQRGQDLRLKRFENYWDPAATNLPALRFITRKEASVRAQAVRTGEAHFAYNIGAEQGAALGDLALVAGGFQSNSLRLNNTIAPTNDVRVRRAINLAIDRDAINKSIFKGTAKPIGFFAYQPVSVQPFPYRPEEAKKLIQEAGVAGQTLELVYGEGRIPEEDQLAEIFKAYLEAVGLKIRLTRLEPRQYNELGSRPFPEQPPLYMETTSSGNYGEVAGALRDKYGCQGTGTFCKPEFDELYNRLGVITGSERQQLLQQVATRLHEEETPRCWVVAVNQVHGIARGVRSSIPLNAYILTRDLSFA
ncbi:ABC transporter substrate-binding protein [Tepidiforma sp.]|uniref:ABC transporter substrate-binding protein n=1 Tax=Tepidiforma sp. TaxID=2682230 RepID=UPI002ADD66C7|nr:ABC transporter substrate-binding protein [Tepidiforma sp.]